MSEILIILFVAAILIGLPVMFVATYIRARGVSSLRQRLERLERAVAELQAARTAERPPEAARVILEQPSEARPEVHPEPVAPQRAAPSPTVPSEPVLLPSESIVLAAEVEEPAGKVSALESIIGGQALGWLAVVVLLFATGFFLRYAFENQWIGPVGRVSLGVLAGTGLALAGRRYHRRGWRVFSQMLTSGGVVLLYLSIYSAFGFYHLISQREASVALALLVVESGLLALAYDAPAIALMAVIGGLLTPLLMHSDRDQYRSLFIYLAMLDAGVAALLVRRRWNLIGVVAMAGTQLLFWPWYEFNYHPEKLGWALGFQTAVFALFLTPTLASWRAGRRAGWEDLIRMPLNAAFWFGAAYVLLRPDYEVWLGSLAVGVAALYALAARWLFVVRRQDEPAQLTALALAMGFLAVAFPLEADAPWVALGWGAQAAGLWWFGVRVGSVPLRVMAAAFAALTAARVGLIDSPWMRQTSAWPVFNRYALPGLAAVICLGGGLTASRRWLPRLSREELALVIVAAIVCVLLIWALVSADIIRYFGYQAVRRSGERDWLRWGQTWLSVWWAAYATAALGAGFYARQAWLRWTALGLYAMAAAKVFLVDMAELDELYRIAAFFVLALVLGAAAWAYQRFQPNRSADQIA